MALRGLYNIKKNNKKELEIKLKCQWTKKIYKSKYQRSFYWLYEGEMINNENHGYGILTKVYKYGTNKKCYDGYWINGKMEGFGGYWYNNSNYYEGNFYDGKRQNFGRMWYNTGNFYQGLWENNLYNGKGMLIYENKNRYEGTFVNGKKTGDGTFYHFKTGQMQMGHWISDICIKSTIIDIYNRQSALKPTPYPIPTMIKTITNNK